MPLKKQDPLKSKQFETDSVLLEASDVKQELLDFSDSCQQKEAGVQRYAVQNSNAVQAEQSHSNRGGPDIFGEASTIVTDLRGHFNTIPPIFGLTLI